MDKVSDYEKYRDGRQNDLRSGTPEESRGRIIPSRCELQPRSTSHRGPRRGGDISLLPHTH